MSKTIFENAFDIDKFDLPNPDCFVDELEWKDKQKFEDTIYADLYLADTMEEKDLFFSKWTMKFMTPQLRRRFVI